MASQRTCFICKDRIFNDEKVIPVQSYWEVERGEKPTTFAHHYHFLNQGGSSE